MKDRLIGALVDVVGLLAACGLSTRADWFRLRLEIIRAGTTNRDVFEATVREIRGILASMGSFTDLPLVPNQDSGLTEDVARRRQWELADELDEVTAALITK